MFKVGFEFRETMAGRFSYTGQPATERPIRFTLHAVSDNALRLDGATKVTGSLEMEDFADEVAVTGSLHITPVTRRTIRYELDFVANDGRPYRLVGQKDVRLTDLRGSLTTLPVEIRAHDGTPVAKAVLYFDLKGDLLSFLSSWKPVLPSRA